MNRVVKILMNRDGLTQQEAEAEVRECQTQLEEAVDCGYYCDAEDVIQDCLGLEPDYLEDILYF